MWDLAGIEIETWCKLARVELEVGCLAGIEIGVVCLTGIEIEAGCLTEIRIEIRGRN